MVDEVLWVVETRIQSRVEEDYNEIKTQLNKENYRLIFVKTNECIKLLFIGQVYRCDLNEIIKINFKL